MDLTESFLRAVPDRVLERYAWAETRNAAAVILSTSPEEFDDLMTVLFEFRVDVNRDFLPGGNETAAAALLNGHFRELGWREGSYTFHIVSRLILQPFRAAGETNPVVQESEVDADSYRIDNIKGRVALDVEWHAKDGNLDRDISAYRALYDAGIIDAAAIITVQQGPMKTWAREYDPNTRKFATTTVTSIEKSVPRLRRGDPGGCPLVVIGIGPQTV